MRKYLRNLTFGWLALWSVLGLAQAAQAHAVVVQAQPALEQRVAAGPLDIRLEFNSRIDKARSKLQLTRPDGGRADIAIDPDGEPNVVTAKAAQLMPGAYVLRWQVLAVDGHITRGDIPFTVGQ